MPWVEYNLKCPRSRTVLMTQFEEEKIKVISKS
jgi:hypothetical protein